MAEKSEITVDWVRRLIWVDTTTLATVQFQDLIDTLAKRHEDWEAGPWDYLYEAGEGKAPIGGGTLTELVLTLLDTRIAFKGNTTPEETGVVTTGDASGTRLIDSSAQFATKNIQPGAAVYNKTDGSTSMVYEVISENELEMPPLEGGIDNQWDLSDDYAVYNVIVCKIVGGTLVSLDDLGDEQDAVFPTPHTQVVVAQAASGTLIGQEETSLNAEIARKMLTNRFELSEGQVGNHVLYDDNDSDVFMTFDIKNKNFASIALPIGAPAKRSKGY